MGIDLGPVILVLLFTYMILKLFGKGFSDFRQSRRTARASKNAERERVKDTNRELEKKLDADKRTRAKYERDQKREVLPYHTRQAENPKYFRRILKNFLVLYFGGGFLLIMVIIVANVGGFVCDNGNHVPHIFVNDDMDDCGDNSDEWGGAWPDDGSWKFAFGCFVLSMLIVALNIKRQQIVNEKLGEYFEENPSVAKESPKDENVVLPPFEFTPPPNPSIPKIPKPAKTPNYWPWAQQEKWSERKVAGQVKAAMMVARSEDIAQATVLIDEVGPHLGDRSKLIYPIGALLQRIGRGKAVDKLLVSALKALPNDPNVASAKAKLAKVQIFGSAEEAEERLAEESDRLEKLYVAYKEVEDELAEKNVIIRLMAAEKPAALSKAKQTAAARFKVERDLRKKLDADKRAKAKQEPRHEIDELATLGEAEKRLALETERLEKLYNSYKRVEDVLAEKNAIIEIMEEGEEEYSDIIESDYLRWMEETLDSQGIDTASALSRLVPNPTIDDNYSRVISTEYLEFLEGKLKSLGIDTSRARTHFEDQDQ